MSFERFPATRYQGSKRKLLPWLHSVFAELDFDTCLDAFAGTSSVAYLLKTLGKSVTTNDYLECNRVVSRALVVNSGSRLAGATVDGILERKSGHRYDGFIRENFENVFFLDDENDWLDTVVQNIDELDAPFQRELALFALFQACLAKRPYNLFHRANLYMRTADVKRSFGNKATWDAPFESLFRQALEHANSAIFDSGRQHEALAGDCLLLPAGYDLVYLDPPYFNARGVGVDYLDFYHFLEGLCCYERWPSRIRRAYKHRPLERQAARFQCAVSMLRDLEELFAVHRHSTLVVSYRGDGVPGVEQIAEALRRLRRRRPRIASRPYQYALSRGARAEVLIVSEP